MRTIFLLLFLLIAAGTVGCTTTQTPAARPVESAMVLPVPAAVPPPHAPPHAPPEEIRTLVGRVSRQRDGSTLITSIDGEEHMRIGGPRAVDLASRPSPVLARIRGVVRGGFLEVSEVAASVDGAEWERDEADYDAALAQAEQAFTREDAAGARQALERARDVAAMSFGELAAHSATFAFIDGLATRFGSACDLVAKGADAVPYADAVIPLRRAQLTGAERGVVLAAFRFAQRRVFRVLQAERGVHRDVVRGRAILRMAGIDAKSDTPMMRWVYAHVPEAARGLP